METLTANAQTLDLRKPAFRVLQSRPGKYLVMLAESERTSNHAAAGHTQAG
jgi:hypothetical protein